MIDKRLYCETFSRLCASEEAKKEVFQRMNQKNVKKLPRLLRGAAIAAAMTMALAITAGAVNLATGGVLIQSLRQVWTDGYETRYEGLDSDGNPMTVSVSQGSRIHITEDGRMLLQSAGEEVDITDEITEYGEFHFEKAMESRMVKVDVTGTVEDWELVEEVSEEDGITYRSSFTSEDMPGEITVSNAIVNVGDDVEDDGAIHSAAMTVTDNGEGGFDLVDEEGNQFSSASLPTAELAEP